MRRGTPGREARRPTGQACDVPVQPFHFHIDFPSARWYALVAEKDPIGFWKLSSFAFWQADGLSTADGEDPQLLSSASVVSFKFRHTARRKS